MGGFFGVAAKSNCLADLFYGTDYHSHLGTKRGGLAVVGDNGFVRVIHNIENAQFRSKFDPDLERLAGRLGIGVISDTDDQPLLIRSHLGDYAIATVGVVANAEALAREAFGRRRIHLSEMGSGDINPTEVVASLIDMEDSFESGIRRALAEIEGSCSLLILTRDGIYAARDRRGRTPVIIGRKDGATAVTFETCAFPNLDYQGGEGPRAPARSPSSPPTAGRAASRRGSACRSAASCGSITATRPRPTKGSTSRRCATAAAPPWPAASRPPSTTWPASPTRASATAWATPPRPACPSSAPSSSTPPPGPAASCPSTRRSATWWRA